MTKTILRVLAVVALSACWSCLCYAEALKKAPANVELGVLYGGTGAADNATALNNLGGMWRFERFSSLASGSKTLAISDAGIIQNNIGATENTTYTLPECTASTLGSWWPFQTSSADYQISVLPNAGQSWANTSGATTGQGMAFPASAHARGVARCIQLDDSSYAPIFEHDGTVDLIP